MSGELWLAEGFTSYYGPLDHEAGRPDDRRARSRRTWARRSTRSSTSPGRPAPVSAEEMSQMAPFVDRGVVDRSDQLRQHLHLLLHVGLGDWARPRPDAARSQRRQVTLDDFMRALWEKLRPARAREGPWLRRDAVHDRRPEDGARPRCRATRRLPRTSSPATSRATRSWTTASCSRGPASSLRLRTPGVPSPARCTTAGRSGGVRVPATCPSGRRPIRPASSATMSSCRSAARGSTRAADVERASTTRKPGESLPGRLRAARRAHHRRRSGSSRTRALSSCRRRSGADVDRRADDVSAKRGSSSAARNSIRKRVL